MPNGKQAIEQRYDLENLPPGEPSFAPKGIPIEDIIELRRKNLTVGQIGTLLGCSPQNVTLRLSRIKEDLEGLENYKKHRADVQAWHQRKILNSLSDEDIKKSSMLQKVTAIGILYDKERLERGQTTANVGHVDYTGRLQDLEAQEAALMAELGMTPEDD